MINKYKKYSYDQTKLAFENWLDNSDKLVGQYSMAINNIKNSCKDERLKLYGSMGSDDFEDNDNCRSLMIHDFENINKSYRIKQIEKSFIETYENLNDYVSRKNVDKSNSIMEPCSNMLFKSTSAFCNI